MTERAATGRGIPLLFPAAGCLLVAGLYCGLGWDPVLGFSGAGALLLLCGLSWWRLRRAGLIGPWAGSLLATAACASALLCGAAVDSLGRASAQTLIGERAQEATLVLKSDPREVAPGLVIAEASLESLSGKALQRSVDLDVSAGGARLPAHRGDRVTLWVRFAEPSKRGPVAVVAKALSAPVIAPEVASDPLTVQRRALLSLAGWWQDGQSGLAQGAALMPGMVAGDRGLQDEALTTEMTVAGLSHLTAVSGANVAMVLAGIAAALRLVRFPRRWMLLPLGLGLVAFVVLVGPEPSVLRAAVSGGAAAVAVILGRARLALSLLALAVCVLLMVDPWQVSRVAFQLSVAATAGIALLARPVAGLLNERAKWPRVLAEAVAVSLAATVACTPILVTLAPEQSALTIPLNVLAAPLAAVTGLFGPLLLVLAPLGPVLTWPLALLSIAPAQGIAALAQLSGQLGWYVSWPEGATGPVLAGLLCWGIPAGVALVVYTRGRRRARSAGRAGFGRAGNAWVAPWRFRWRRLRWRQRLVATACVFALIIVSVVAGVVVQRVLGPRAALGPLRAGDLLFCDVGQGDAMALVGEEGAAFLVDVGPEKSDAVSCLKGAGITRLCGIMISHLDADHVGGLDGVDSAFPGAPLWYGTASRSAPATGAIRGEVGKLPACGPWTLSIVAAPEATDENDASLVLRAHSAVGTGLDLLSAGDLEETGAGPVAHLRGVQPFDETTPRVLKVSHHGARNGGSQLIDAFRPQLALIGVGKNNDYGHPAQPTLEALSREGATILRTDLNGSVVVRPGTTGLSVGANH